MTHQIGAAGNCLGLADQRSTPTSNPKPDAGRGQWLGLIDMQALTDCAGMFHYAFFKVSSFLACLLILPAQHEAEH